MADTLTALTIAELFQELTRVERAIRDCDPLFQPVGDHAALSPRLIDLAVQEHEICNELARRRAGLRVELVTTPGGHALDQCKIGGSPAPEGPGHSPTEVSTDAFRACPRRLLTV
jgi:hypothetical protein